MYERMKEDANSKEEAKVITQTINTLKKQLKSIQKSRKNYTKNQRPRPPPKYKRILRKNQKNPRRNQMMKPKYIPVEERLEKNLKEVYLHYCRKQVALGRHFTFEQNSKEYSIMHIGELLIFCREFNILRNAKIVDKKALK